MQKKTKMDHFRDLMLENKDFFISLMCSISIRHSFETNVHITQPALQPNELSYRNTNKHSCKNLQNFLHNKLRLAYNLKVPGRKITHLCILLTANLSSFSLRYFSLSAKCRASDL